MGVASDVDWAMSGNRPFRILVLFLLQTLCDLFKIDWVMNGQRRSEYVLNIVANDVSFIWASKGQ